MRTLLISLALTGLASGLAAQADDLELARTQVSPDTGWHFAFGFGYVAWGEESRPGGATPAVDVGIGYELDGGVGLEYRLTLTEAEFLLLDNAVGGYYFPRLRSRSLPVGGFAAVGLPIKMAEEHWRELVDYRAWSYGFGLRFRAVLNERRTAVFAELGVLTIKESFTERLRWRDDGDIDWAVRNSGLRLRVGMAF